ncbi:cupin-like domain-containing protein [Flavihumibacter sp. CACIAM 22H1]|uniref:cupin-like domain-containing protein n=1 Tax=Flavihumibacter sp. CACIAM 22H1 TaxID=1812911 RepID=UPI0007A935CD|nr:cupin-like domain-containing protein [Flavihumibacter sp. CACIAM 22H1]KYP16398.1 MAG: transcriptional regulator [Flavihumibacter sp. CACIAM 22H1]
MVLKSIDVWKELSPAEFRSAYYEKGIPVVIKNLSHTWPAYQKWDWDYFKDAVGKVQVGVYNNTKSDARTPVNKADDTMLFGEYIDQVRKGPVELRIFLFNLFTHAPQLAQDFTWPDAYLKSFVKRFPMLFVGGQGSVTHMHFDIDMSHILHTQFFGRKRVLLFPFDQQHLLYRKPWEVLSFANFEKYYDPLNSKLDLETYPLLKQAIGYDLVLEHGDTLFMPAGYWHHMEYLDSGFAMSLRALQESWTGKIHGAWNLFGMRTIDTMMKKTAPNWWYDYKKKKITSFSR